MKRCAFFFLGVLLLAASSCTHAPYELSPDERKGDPSLCFERDILPIFITECAKSGCHDAGSHEEGYILDSYEHITRKGITPGNAAGSKIYESITRAGEEQMPKDAPSLSPEKIQLIQRWINAGAVKDSNCSSGCDSNNFVYNNAIRPLVNKYCTSCHSGTSPQGSLDLSTYNNLKDAVVNRNLVKCINYANGYSGMPKGMRLTACQIRQVEKWVDAGMQNN
jgi:hypothetical protein